MKNEMIKKMVISVVVVMVMVTFVQSASAFTLPVSRAPKAPTLSFAVLYGPVTSVVWEDNSSNEYGFIVERNVSGKWMAVARVRANSNHCEVESASTSPQNTYYRVVAYNKSGKSYSNTRHAVNYF
jgi:hypothetical protein